MLRKVWVQYSHAFNIEASIPTIQAIEVKPETYEKEWWMLQKMVDTHTRSADALTLVTLINIVEEREKPCGELSFKGQIQQ